MWRIREAVRKEAENKKTEPHDMSKWKNSKERDINGGGRKTD